MANTLLSIAKADIKTAKSLVNSDDKYQKHQAAYMTQQGVEKTLKYVISLKTGGQPWGHDIDKLVKIAQVYIQLQRRIPQYKINGFRRLKARK